MSIIPIFQASPFRRNYDSICHTPSRGAQFILNGAGSDAGSGRWAHFTGAHANAIDWNNKPDRFNVEMVININQMEKTGKAKQRPWADTYWPTFQDGVNHRWQTTGNFFNDLSPAEKYDWAFNGWDPKTVENLKPYNASYGSFHIKGDEGYYRNLGSFASAVSSTFGNKSTRDAAARGELEPDGSAKSGRKEEDYGGIQTWWGLCHTWVPASIREPEPLHAVDYKMPNGQMVRFEVSDIKALLIACYNRSRSTMIGLRNEEKEIQLTPNGRAKQPSAQDINPGTLHIVATTLLGRDKMAFAEDRTANYEVWNQPAQEYEITKQEPITKEEACRLLDLPAGNYEHNPAAKKFYHVNMKLDYITESHASTRPNAENDAQERSDYYDYILECDENDNVIGGEWLGSSKTEHPDFLWHIYESGGTALSPSVSLEKVRELNRLARLPVDGGGGGEVVDFKETITLAKAQTQEFVPIQIKTAGVLEFMTSGVGDLDVYAKKGAAPTFEAESGKPLDTDLFLYEPGSNERKTLNVEVGDVVYVSARAFEDSSRATLTIKHLQ